MRAKFWQYERSCVVPTARGKPLVLESNTDSRMAKAFANIARRLCTKKTLI